MANMSYCRFENTYRDLCDCFDALDGAEDLDGLNLSRSERRYFEWMVEKCRDYIEAYERLEDVEFDDDEFNGGL